MRKLIYALLPLLAVCCTKPHEKEEATVKLTVEYVSSTGCEIAVEMDSLVTDYYLMAILPQSSYTEEKAKEALGVSSRYTNRKRVFERLKGEKSYTVAVLPVGKDGVPGALSTVSFTLEDMDLDVLLYTPGAGSSETMNRHNTLNMMAFSNGIAAKLRCALALNENWVLLRAQMSMREAAEEVFSNTHIDFTRQMLEELADRNEMKRDILYFHPLEAGVKYTLVVCLEDLDGESHYYSFDGKTVPLED